MNKSRRISLERGNGIQGTKVEIILWLKRINQWSTSTNIRKYTTMSDVQQIAPRECLAGKGVCFRCRNLRHVIQDCPKKPKEIQRPSNQGRMIRRARLAYGKGRIIGN